MPHPLIPPAFHTLVAGRAPEPDIGGDDWLRRLPRLIDDALERWELTVDGAPRHGQCALVIPVSARGATLAHAPDGRAVLKLTWPHREASTEHLALRNWNGEGAVRLLAADPAAYVLVLERLDADRDLTRVPILEACEVIGGLFRRLDRPAGPQFDALTTRARRWLDHLRLGHSLVPRRLTEQASTTMEHLLDGTVDGRLVHEDLHDMNVLAPLDPARGDWLAIDPKPVSGEWAYAVAPLVWNRADATAAAANLRRHVRLRADIVADCAGLDPDRVTRWTFVRLVLNALWAGRDGPAFDDVRARMIALAKAFAD